MHIKIEDTSLLAVTGSDDADIKKATSFETSVKDEVGDEILSKLGEDLNALNEKSFNFIVCDADENTALEKSAYTDIYMCVKYIIEDSILDDNNNIVNYTLPNEISVVRVMLNYTYGR